jgi:amidase
VAAGFAPVALGTETDGSIVCPANVNGVVGIKPTVGLTSRAGVIPISHTQDTIGPFARSVADAALVLGALAGEDERDPATSASAGRYHRDYSRFLDPNGLRGARIGVPRNGFFGYDERVDTLIEGALQLMREAGAVIIDPADLPSAEAMRSSKAEMTVLLYEFKHDIAAYLTSRLPLPGAGDTPRTLADLITFNQANADREMPFFGQELFEQAEAMGPLSDPAYKAALVESKLLSQEQGIDAVIATYRLDALVAPTGGPAWPINYESGDPHGGGSSSGPAAMAGYPLISVPAGFVDGLPVGITFMGPAFGEPALIRLAHAYELRRGPFAAPAW